MADAKDMLSFWVDGPIRGEGRPRVTMHGTFIPKATREAKDRVRAAALAEMPEGAPRPLFAGRLTPVAVQITTWRPLPASRPKAVTHEADTFMPDVDNVAKLVMDALNGIAWEDDRQVTYLAVTKSARTRLRSEMMLVQVWPDETADVPTEDGRGEVAADA